MEWIIVTASNAPSGKRCAASFADVDLHALRRRVPRCLRIEVDAFGVPAQLLHELEQSAVAAAARGAAP